MLLAGYPAGCARCSRCGFCACQRLEYLQDYRLRVPLCEVPMANSNAKGTIRGGAFSQLATVIQSGGDDGMWSFDRYRRWMEQKKDWVMPSRQIAGKIDEKIR